MTEASTTETWIERVSAWRESGERADEFSRRGGYASSTLRWWASKLRRELASASATAVAAATPEVRLARVVRRAEPSARSVTSASAPSSAVITLELEQLEIRIAVGAGADHATLAMVLGVLGVSR